MLLTVGTIGLIGLLIGRCMPDGLGGLICNCPVGFERDGIWTVEVGDDAFRGGFPNNVRFVEVPNRGGSGFPF